MAGPIDAWLGELDGALASRRRLRDGRIRDEALDHLRLAADRFERGGLARSEAEARAVAQLGDPYIFAAGFAAPRRRDHLVDLTAWVTSRAGLAFVGLGGVCVLIEAVAWVLGAGPVSHHGIRVWQSCPNRVDGQCVGEWEYSHAPRMLVLGVILVVVGLVVLGAFWILRRRYSDLELVPRRLGTTVAATLAVLGVVLLVGGGVRSALDTSWYWVPVWLVGGTVTLLVAATLWACRGPRGWLSPRSRGTTSCSATGRTSGRTTGGSR
ncbi:hypothetical protein [Nocardioides hungaricus]